MGGLNVAAWKRSMECQRGGSGLCSCASMVDRLSCSWFRVLRESRRAFGYSDTFFLSEKKD